MPIDPFTSFMEGYRNSQQMGLLKLQAIQGQREYAAKQQAAEAEAKKAEFEQDNKKIDLLRKIQEDPNAADADKLSAYNALSPLIKKHHGFEMSPLDKWDTEYTKAAKRINAIWDNENYAPEDRLKLVRGVYSEVSQATAEKLKPQLEQAQKEAESGSYSRGMTLSRQIASTPELAQSPEIMNQMLTEKERLLSGSAKGQDVVAKGLEKGDTESQSTDTVNQLGQAMFGKNWDKLSQAEKQKVIDKKFSMDAAIAGARTTATGMATQNIPMEPGELANFVTPDNLTPLPIGTTPAQASQMGAIKVNPQQKSDYLDLTKSVASVSELNNLADKLITATNPLEAAKQYALLTGGAYTKANPEAAVYVDMVDAFLSNLARTFGEKGVLTDLDVGRMRKALISFGDTIATKKEKQRIMNEMLSVAQEVGKAKILGINPNEKDLKRINTLSGQLDKVGKSSGLSTAKPAKSWKEFRANRGY